MRRCTCGQIHRSPSIGFGGTPRGGKLSSRIGFLTSRCNYQRPTGNMSLNETILQTSPLEELHYRCSRRIRSGEPDPLGSARARRRGRRNSSIRSRGHSLRLETQHWGQLNWCRKSRRSYDDSRRSTDSSESPRGVVVGAGSSRTSRHLPSQNDCRFERRRSTRHYPCGFVRCNQFTTLLRSEP
jgi:hypothetical protein